MHSFIPKTPNKSHFGLKINPKLNTNICKMVAAAILNFNWMSNEDLIVKIRCDLISLTLKTTEKLLEHN